MLAMAVSLVLLALIPFIPFLYTSICLLIRQYRSPLRHLPGPPSPSLFMGNLQQMHDQENTNLIAQWVSQYGPTFVYRGFLGGRRLITTDPVAIAHILANPYQYPKPDFIRDALASMALGHDGLLTVEGDRHQHQRRILTPAFSVAHIKSLTPIFWEKASQLRDIWLLHLPDNPDAIQPQPSVDVLVWLGRATLDVIGLAGFGYAFNSLSQDSNELASAFDIIFSTARKFKRRHNAIMVQAKNTMHRIGLDLINGKQHPIGTETVRVSITEKDKGSRGTHIPQIDDRDLLSILIRSNTSSTPSQRMSIDEVLCQISTFLAAGHETTCSALTWCLYALAKDQRVQSKLRDVLRGIQDQLEENVRHDVQELGYHQETLTNHILTCTYLDWVVRECLRLHAPVTNTMRVCMRDYDEIPLLHPINLPRHAGERICVPPEDAMGLNEGASNIHHDKHGNQIPVALGISFSETHRRAGGSKRTAATTVPIRKWDIISVPIQAINKSEMFWGEDGGMFRPERWATPPQDARLIPSLYSNMLTFLNGNRACIGYKFAIFDIVARPFVKSEAHLGNRLPLNISRADSGMSTSRSPANPALPPPSARSLPER